MGFEESNQTLIKRLIETLKELTNILIEILNRLVTYFAENMMS